MSAHKRCRAISQLVSESMDRELTLFESVRVRFHLLGCDGCTNFKKQAHFMRDAVKHWAEHD